MFLQRVQVSSRFASKLKSIIGICKHIKVKQQSARQLEILSYLNDDTFSTFHPPPSRGKAVIYSKLMADTMYTDAEPKVDARRS